MALTLQSLQSDQLVKQRKGYISISTTEWTTANEDLVCEGSSFECADSVYYASADEDIDSTATLAGLGNGTWVYVYFSPATLALYCSGTAPAWDDAKQGWYLGASPTHRCIFIFYKVGAGNYSNKTIPLNRNEGINYTNTITNPNYLTANGTYLGPAYRGFIYRTSAGVETYRNLMSKIIEIGDWDMDANTQVNVNHGVSDSTKIRNIQAIIQLDSDEGSYGNTYPLDTVRGSVLNGGINTITSTNISLTRIAGGFFDSTQFNMTSYNRGWIIIQYEI